MTGKKINELRIGDKASFGKTITETDICLFSGISGDFNPIHINDEIGKESRFKNRIAHGLLTASLISTVIGTKLPGIGTLYYEQNLKFTAPVFIGDTIRAEVEVIEIFQEKNIVKLKTTCRKSNGDIVIEGDATVLPPI